MQDIRRTVFIPKFLNGEDVIALIEVGGQVFSKEMIYRKFFEHGLENVRSEILDEIIKRGGTEKDFHTMMKKASTKKVTDYPSQRPRKRIRAAKE